MLVLVDLLCTITAGLFKGGVLTCWTLIAQGWRLHTLNSYNQRIQRCTYACKNALVLSCCNYCAHAHTSTSAPLQKCTPAELLDLTMSIHCVWPVPTFSNQTWRAGKSAVPFHSMISH